MRYFLNSKRKAVQSSSGTIAVAVGLVGFMLSAAGAQSRVDIGSLSADRSVVIEGTVTGVFGNRFLLEDQTGRTLVETGPPHHHRLFLREGESVRVVGEPERDGFEAFRIIRADGTMIVVRDPEGPPPWAGPGRSPRNHGEP
jgi:uncharacterized protein YdeI (BOF family)